MAVANEGRRVLLAELPSWDEERLAKICDLLVQFHFLNVRDLVGFSEIEPIAELEKFLKE